LLHAVMVIVIMYKMLQSLTSGNKAFANSKTCAQLHMLSALVHNFVRRYMHNPLDGVSRPVLACVWSNEADDLRAVDFCSGLVL